MGYICITLCTIIGLMSMVRAGTLLKQPITFHDGKIGVIIDGFSASVDLNGLSTGDINKAGFPDEVGNPIGSAGVGIGNVLPGGKHGGVSKAGANPGAAAADIIDSLLVTFNGGEISVNFGGFSVSAGLGGLLTGDAAKGVLHAEIGIPIVSVGIGPIIKGQDKGKSAGDSNVGANSGAAAEVGLTVSTSSPTSVESTTSGGAGGTTAGGSTAGANSGADVAAEVGFVATTSAPGSIRGSVESTTSGSAGGTIDVGLAELTSTPGSIASSVESATSGGAGETTAGGSNAGENSGTATTADVGAAGSTSAPESIGGSVESATSDGTWVSTVAEHQPSPVEETIEDVPVTQKNDPSVEDIDGRYGYSKFLGVLFAKGKAGFGAGSVGSGGGGGGASYSKTDNSRFITDIFNIPISTLSAVNKLVGGISRNWFNFNF